MGLSTDVTVSGNRSVVFPDECVLCGRDACGETTPLRGNPVGVNGVFSWILRRTKLLHVPAHPRCGRMLRLAVLWRNVSLLALATIGLVIALYLNWTKSQMVYLVIGMIALPVIWQTVRPVAFEFTHTENHYKLMFRSRKYARIVRALNEGSIEDGD